MFENVGSPSSVIMTIEGTDVAAIDGQQAAGKREIPVPKDGTMNLVLENLNPLIGVTIAARDGGGKSTSVVVPVVQLSGK
jgi:hypothetical protein